MANKYSDDLNHLQWLATVPGLLLQFVATAVDAWDAQADCHNKWSVLGWDERDSLVHAQAGCNSK
jgi:hypothetical protein